MNDLFDHADHRGERAAPPSVAKPAPRFAGMSPREIVMLLAAIAIFIWGAWVSKSLVTDDASDQEFVQLQLQSIISEYLTAQARSNADEQTAAQQTGMFMTTLDRTVASLSQSGKIILVHEAVVGGDVPDVTESVKAAVYAKVPRPQMAQAPRGEQSSQAARVQGEMQAFMASSEGGESDGAR